MDYQSDYDQVTSFPLLLIIKSDPEVSIDSEEYILFTEHSFVTLASKGLNFSQKRKTKTKVCCPN